MLSNQNRIYLSRYFHQNKYPFCVATSNIKIIPFDIRQTFVSVIIYTLIENLVSDIIRNLRIINDFCNITFISVTRMSLIISSNSIVKSRREPNKLCFYIAVVFLCQVCGKIEEKTFYDEVQVFRHII
jgi:hypothetical protein